MPLHDAPETPAAYEPNVVRFLAQRGVVRAVRDTLLIQAITCAEPSVSSRCHKQATLYMRMLYGEIAT